MDPYCEVVAEGPVARLRLRGELDMASADALRLILVGAITTFLAHVIVVDLALVSFMDLAGLHEIMDAHYMLLGSGSQLVVANATGVVERLLELTRAGDVLDIRPRF